MGLSSTSVFSTDEKLGLGFTVVGGSISLLSVTGILLYTAFKRLRGQHYGSDVSDSNLFLNLMLAHLIHAIGVIFNMKWAVEGDITEGRFCTTQAVLKQIGINGISFTSLAITIYIFLVLVLYWKPGEHISMWTIVGIWVLTGFIVIIPNIIHKPDVYYGNTHLWCWITSRYIVGRLLSEYVWVWFTGLAMLVLYPIITLRIWGIVRATHMLAPQAETSHQEIRVVARKLLLYPIIYIICIVPNSASRWLTFTDHDIPNRLVLATNSIHALSGFFHLVVFCNTRPAMVFGRRCDKSLQNHWNERNDGFVRVARNNHFDSTSTLETDVTNDGDHSQQPVMSESRV